MSDSNHITALRAHLFDAIRGVKSGELEVDKARAINDLSKTLVDTARVEVDFLRATGGLHSPFIEPQRELPNGITGIVQHKLKG